MPSASSSHAVSRAPWSSGRVSSTHTCATSPSSHAARIAPSAEPYPPVARAARVAVREDRASAATSSTAWRPSGRQRSTSAVSGSPGPARGRRGAHLLERPGEVHGRRTRASSTRARRRVLPAPRRQRVAVRRGDADRRRARGSPACGSPPRPRPPSGSAARPPRPAAGAGRGRRPRRARAGRCARARGPVTRHLAASPEPGSARREPRRCRAREQEGDVGEPSFPPLGSLLVPSSQDCACSSVSSSMAMPIVASLSRAISSSMSFGTS